MSSATLTDARRSRKSGGRPAPSASPAAPADHSGPRPWHFFLLATISLATVTVVLMREQSAPAIVLVALIVGAAGYAGYGAYRMLNPLVTAEEGEATVMLGGRTRAALERDKGLTLRAIKELEFDRAMGKVAEADFVEMRDRLRLRAMRLIRQLDGAAAYREAIERDLASRLPAATDPAPAAAEDAAAGARVFCTQCGAPAEADARFCKMCGRPLHASA